MDIPDQPFDKAIYLVTHLNISKSGEPIHSDHYWPFDGMARSISHSQQTLLSAFSTTVCSRFILVDNRTEFKNQLMDDVLKQLGINDIFSTPYHPQSNGKLEVFNKYLKPTPMKLCGNNQDNWDLYFNQVLTSYYVTPHLTTAEAPFFLIYGREPQSPTTPSVGTCAISWQPQICMNKIGNVCCLALTIAKKILVENRVKQCTKGNRSHSHLGFKFGDSLLLRTNNPANRIWNGEQIQDCLYWAWWTLPPYRK